MDGSSAPFVSLLYTAGREAQVAVRRSPLRVLEPIRVGDEHRWMQILPAAEFRISYTLDHEHPAVGVQVASFVPTDGSSSEELAPARTYGFLKDLELLRQQGLALGGSLDNAVVVGQERILNGTLRFQDEFVRHKILDVIGDLALVGRPLLGHVVARNGIRLNHQLMRELVKTARRRRLRHRRTSVRRGAGRATRRRRVAAHWRGATAPSPSPPRRGRTGRSQGL
jgi:UDP-3-O-[3-hydroxymyristoyl] N-acetylglucosamine deacetylase